MSEAPTPPELLIFDQMLDSIALYDQEGRYLYVNAAMLALVGQPREQLLGRRIWDIFPEARDNAFSQVLRRVIATGQSEHLEHLYEPWERWFDNRFYSTPAGVCVIAIDITLQKHAEHAVQAARRQAEWERQRLAELFQASPAAIAVLRAPDWSYELSNAKNDELGGKGPLVGRRVLDVLPELAAQGFTDLLNHVLHTGEPWIGTEVKVTVGQGASLREMYLNGSYQPLREADGRIDRVMAFAYEVTEQVRARQRTQDLADELSRSEARARRLQDSGVIGVVFWTRDGRLVDANEAFLRMVGYTRDELLGGEVRWTAMTPPDLAYLDAQAFVEMEATGICAPYEKQYIAKDGRRIPILIGVAFWEGSTDSGVAWIVDISERRAAETERDGLLESERQARAEAEQANRSKDEFLASVSHELRTPLNAMLGWARMLSSGSLDPERQKRAIDAIERNAVAQAQLIEDLLDVSRIVSGKLELELGEIELRSVIEAALDTVRPLLESKQIQLEVSFAGDVGSILGDAQRLLQVVWNLLSNAVKFSQQGGRVEVRLQHFASYAELVISDNGRGIAPQALPFIFDSFRQADASITRSFGGLGLGLSIARQLVELHGGRIEASSEGEGKGATFTVRLLRNPPGSSQSRPDRAAQAVTASELESPTELDGLRILVVDDEADARELVSTILRQFGARVTTAASAEEALRLIVAEPHDVMLSDIGMPEQDGYELIRRIRLLEDSVASKIPAAALTAYARSDDRMRAMRAGYQLHVSKPVEPQELTAVVACLARIGRGLA